MFIYCCPACKSFERHVNYGELYSCSKCGRRLLDLGISSEEWSSLAKSEKQTLIIHAMESAKTVYDGTNTGRKSYFPEDLNIDYTQKSMNSLNTRTPNSFEKNKKHFGFKTVALVSMVVIVFLGIILMVSVLRNQGSESSSSEINKHNMNKLTNESEGLFLPRRIEKILSGGFIPNDAQPEYSIDDSLPYQMLWGKWVPEDDALNSISKKEYINIGDKEVECFPTSMVFAASWAGVPKDSKITSIYEGSNLANQMIRQDRMSELDVYSKPNPDLNKTTWNNDSFGEAVENMGYGFGACVYDIKPVEDPDDPVAKISQIKLLSPNQKAMYCLRDNILAIGMTNLYSEDTVDETDIYEVDYQISYKNYRLVLKYNDLERVYIPDKKKSDYSPYEFDSAGAIDEAYTVDSIQSITHSYTGNQIIQNDVHDALMDVSIEFSDEGIMSIDTQDGQHFEYEFFYAGDALTLYKESEIGIYSPYTYRVPSNNVKAAQGFYVGDYEVRTIDTVGQLLTSGLSMDMDSNLMINPGEVTNEIKMMYRDASMVIKACNPWDVSCPLAECEVCYIRIDDKTGIISKGRGIIIGESTRDYIEFVHEPPYEKTKNTLRYKASVHGIATMESSSFGKMFSGYERILNSDGREVIYEFEDDILKDVRIEDPGYLYAGLQDNVEMNLLERLDAAEFTGILKVRDNILDRIKEEFIKNNVEANINEITGEVSMPSDILFGFDEYEMSSEGREYVDSFIKAYASALTEEDIYNELSEIVFEGHTDSTGNYTYNLNLSQQRADEVLDYSVNCLSKELSSDKANKIKEIAKAKGYAFTDLIFDEDGREIPEKSRRVCIKFYVNID